MSVEMYLYKASICDGNWQCVGDCDLCHIPHSDEYYEDEQDDDD